MAQVVLTDNNIVVTNREKALLLKRHALHCKYEKAVALYADTDRTIKDIAKECNVSVGGLGSYLRRYWRELVLRRHQIYVGGKKAEEIKIMEAGKQNVNAHAKYKDAVAACDSLNYIDLNVSQIARKFGTEGTALANFMRIHYPETLVWREKVRQRLGINDNIRHGARPECMKQYAEAVELYRNTGMTMAEVAEACKVSLSGFGQHLRFYHKEILEQKKVIKNIKKDISKLLSEEDKEFKKCLTNEQKTKYKTIQKLQKHDLKKEINREKIYKANPQMEEFAKPQNSTCKR